MPEIGDQLRETRMRNRIDITDVEAATKIRAKYLRALENEEWELLPGPTFVKTFLRTYADYLGLDARNLVEEYRSRYERPAPQELTPFGTSLGGRRAPAKARVRTVDGGAAGRRAADRRALPARHVGRRAGRAGGRHACRDARAERVGHTCGRARQAAQARAQDD